ncbi:hypothetical protein GCM10008949_32820 [Deinococcus humi]|nr:hypothetical protein GCM10008949_32820 [Deinococcus humi]
MERLADPTTPAPEVLRLADALFSRSLIYVQSGQNLSDEMVQGILHAVVKTLLAQEERAL